MFCEKSVHEFFAIFAEKHPSWIFSDSGVQLYQKETPTQVFSCKYRKIFKNTYFEGDLRTDAFDHFNSEIVQPIIRCTILSLQN